MIEVIRIGQDVVLRGCALHVRGGTILAAGSVLHVQDVDNVNFIVLVGKVDPNGLVWDPVWVDWGLLEPLDKVPGNW